MAISYKREKPSGIYDALIIGSGMSGIALAAILAKSGKRCLVLERHYTPGGFTHVFRRRDYEWDVGVHYIGEVHRRNSTMRRMFDYISDGALEWADMGEVYDRLYFGSKYYDLVKGTENFREAMKGYFPAPADQKAIDAYLGLLQEATSGARGLFMTRMLPALARKIAGPWLSRKAGAFARQTTRSVLSGLTHNEELIGVLTGQFGDYGLPPSQSSFLMHATVARHYLNGGAYPVGGSARIFDTIEPVIEAAGGAVFVSAEVEKILVRQGKAIGVRMADGQEIMAPLIVSSAGVEVTYGQLLADERAGQAESRKLEAVPHSAAHICLYMGLRYTPEELGLPKTNYWIYPGNYNHDENCARYLADPEHAEFPLLYASFPAAKDPDFQNRYPGRSTIELLTLGDYGQFSAWEQMPWKKRGEAYEALKSRLTEGMLQRFFEIMPQLEGKLDHCELSTPLSTRHFVNYARGEIYGLAHTPERFANTAISARTPFKNLYLTGQDVVTCGIGGALNAAFLTVSAINGENAFNRLRKTRSHTDAIS